MAAHSTLPDAQLHEPKGVAGAATQTVYVANGAGSGVWTTLTSILLGVWPIGSVRLSYETTAASGWVKMDDGTEAEFGPGDISLLPPGHDAWVVGNEPAVIIEQTPTEY